MKNQLAQYSVGRVLLHLACLMHDSKFRWHWAGICREFQPSSTCRRFALVALIALPLIIAAQLAHGGTHVWSGAQDGYWANPANWSSGGAPSAYEAAPVVIQFPSGLSARRQTTNNIVNLKVDVISLFGADYEIHSTGLPITLTGAQPPFPYAGNFVSGGGGTNICTDAVFVLAGTNIFFVATNGTLFFDDAPMSGSGGLTKSGSGEMDFLGTSANTYAGTTTVLDGTLLCRNIGYYSWTSSYYGIQAIPGRLVVGDTNATHSPRVLDCFSQFGPSCDLTILAGGTVEVNGEGDENIHSLSLAGGHLVFAPYAYQDYYNGPWYSNYSTLRCWTNVTSSASAFGSSAILGPGLIIFQTSSNHEPAVINVANGSLLFEPELHAQAAVTKTGNGELILANGIVMNTDLFVQAGNLALMSPQSYYPGIVQSLVVSNGAQLTLRGACQMYCAMHLNGYGLGGTNGAIVVEHDGAFLDGVVHLDSDTAIVVTNSADTVGLGGLFAYTALSMIEGPGSLTKKGPGTLQLTGNQTNGMTAPFYVDQGTLALNLTQNLAAVSSPLIVGRTPADGTTAEVRLLNYYLIPTNVPITINDSGTLNLNGYSQSVGPLTLQGGDIKTLGGTLYLTTDVLATNGVGSIISGSLYLGSSKRTFHVAPGYSVNIQAQISDIGSNVGFDLDGGGMLTLSAANIWMFGPIHVNAGVLYARADFALGDSAGGTTIASGARLAIDGRDLGAEPLTLNGDGGGYGALSCSKTNTFSGPVILESDAAINVVNATDRLTFSGPISGAAALTKIGGGTLVFTGNPANSYTGATTVSEGTLELSKGNIAVPGALVIGDGVSLPGSHVVRILSAGQLAGNAPVTINFSGVLDLSSAFFAPQSIGSLTGIGPVKLGVSPLTVGGDNTDAEYGGQFTGTGSLIKQGTGMFTLEGTSDLFFGNTAVNAGTLNVENWLPSSPVTVNATARLMGSGLVGDLSSAGGIVSPGCCPASRKMGAKNLSLDGTSLFSVELAGTNAGVSYSQLAVTGAVNLANATLAPTLGFNSAVSNKFVIIDNDAADPITGTFKNLPEGATFVIGGAQFQITYHGGDGNDVVLTQISAVTAPQLGSISRLPGGAIEIVGSGLPGANYIVEANADLMTTNWVNIGVATAGPLGKISFTDTNAANFSMRFYRLETQ